LRGGGRKYVVWGFGNGQNASVEPERGQNLWGCGVLETVKMPKLNLRGGRIYGVSGFWKRLKCLS